MDRQTLRDCVHRYNAEGLAGLVNRRAKPQPRRLDAGQMAELADRGDGWIWLGRTRICPPQRTGYGRKPSITAVSLDDAERPLRAEAV